jgi:glycolate oxidase FAD binding subunit
VSKSNLTKTDISRLIEQLGADKVQSFPAEGADCGSASDWIVFAESEQEVVKVIRWAGEAQVAILPEGQGARAGYGNPVRKKAVTLSLAKYNQVTEYSVGDLTVTVQAGTPLSHLQAVLKEKGQMLPLDPGWPEMSTAGGIVASALTGPKRFKYGTPRDWVIGLRVVLADGQVISTGGKVVKNVAGYDMNKLFIGSLGTLGVITECTFKLRPHPPEETVIILESSDVNALLRLSRRILDSSLEPSAVEMVNASVLSALLPGHHAAFGLMIGFEDEAKAVEKEQTQVVKWAKEEGITIREILRNEWAAALWRSVGELMPHANGSESLAAKIAVKVSTLPDQAAAAIQMIHRLAEELGIEALIHGGTGTGITLAVLQPKQDQWAIAKELIEKIRQRIEGRLGYVVILHAPSFFKERISVWGKTPAGLFLMRKIKEQLDPEGRFNPGRWVGGI